MQGWEPSSHTSYTYDEAGRLSSSHTTLDPEFGPDDADLFAALRQIERSTGPHGYAMEVATSPDADPNNPEATMRFLAGDLTVDPESGEFIYAATFDWAEKARADFIDRAHKRDADPLNGMLVPVRMVERVRPVIREPHTRRIIE